MTWLARAKTIGATCLLALVVGALVARACTWVLGSMDHPKFILTSATGFTITSSIYSTYAPSGCSGTTPGLLYPGMTRCAVFSVHNNLNVPITVTSISMALTDFGLPAVCVGSNLTIRAFSGSLTVPAGGDANTLGVAGVPVSLNESQTNQDACKNLTYHFRYWGTALYADKTTTVLTSTPNPSTSGQSVTFTATVSANNASTDPIQPSGSVSFYKCPTSAQCAYSSSNLLGSGTIGTGGKGTFATSSLPVGTTYVEAVYPGAGTNFTLSVSNVVTQVVNALLIGTKTALTSSPDPSGLGSPVTLTATVAKTSRTGTPTGTVTFHLGSPTGPVVGTGTLNASGQASTVTSLLPAGTDNLHAVYGGDTQFSGSTSPVRVQSVIAPPTECTGSYPNFSFGNPHFPFINGTNLNDFVYAVGGDYWINGYGGNDCIVAGDGDNYITIGNGNDYVSVGNESNWIAVGNGNDTVSVGNGPLNHVWMGNGNDTVTIETGAYNTVILGSGTDTVTLASPTPLTPIHDTIYGGPGNETIYLGAGSYNAYHGVNGRTNTCHLPAPPASWHGVAAAYYHDTITNCTVVTP